MKKLIMTDDAPQAIGPYTPGVKARGGILFVSGQIPMEPETGELVEGGIYEQTARSLENLKAIVETAGGTLDDVVKTTVYLTDINDFAAMNTVYARYFPYNPPARVCVEVSDLPKHALIEIDLIAVLDRRYGF